MEPINLDNVAAFRQLEFGAKRSGILNFVDVEHDLAVHGAQIASIVAHMVPGRFIVQRAGVMDLRAANNESTVIQLMLIGRIKPHRRVRLSSRASGRLSINRRRHD